MNDLKMNVADLSPNFRQLLHRQLEVHYERLWMVAVGMVAVIMLASTPIDPLHKRFSQGAYILIAVVLVLWASAPLLKLYAAFQAQANSDGTEVTKSAYERSWAAATDVLFVVLLV